MVLPTNGVRPSPPPTMTSKPRLAGAVAMQAKPDVVHPHRGAVVRGGRDRDLELARQEREFRMQGGELAQNLGPDARVFDLVGRDAGPLVGGDVAHAVAASLHAVQAGPRQVGHGVGQLGELDPVELDVLPGGEMAVVAVVAPRDVRQHAQLVRRQSAVRNGDPQHIGVELQVDAVHQAERLELLLGQFTREPPRHLIAKLGDPLGDQACGRSRRRDTSLKFRSLPADRRSGPACRMLSRRLPGRTVPVLIETHRRHVGADGADVVGRRRRQQLVAAGAVLTTAAWSSCVVHWPSSVR